MLLKWALVILLGYFVYKKYIALPPGENNKNNPNLKNRDDSKPGSDDDDYIDFEEVD